MSACMVTEMHSSLLLAFSAMLSDRCLKETVYFASVSPTPRQGWPPGVMNSISYLMVQGVTEDTPLWDEDDALDEAEKKAAAGKPTKGAAAAAKQAAPAKKVPAATGAVIPSAKKAKAKAAAAKNSEAATKVSSQGFEGCRV